MEAMDIIMGWINGLYYCALVVVLFVKMVSNWYISSYCSSANMIQLYLYNYTTLLQLLVMLATEFEIIAKRFNIIINLIFFPFTYICVLC